MAKDPDLFIRQDEEGDTLLHHIAQLGPSMDSSSIGTILEVVFANEKLNFDIQNKEGKTALHSAFILANARETIESIIPKFLKEADKRKTNFEIWDNAGRSIYHYALMKQEYVLRTFSITHRTYSLIDLINTHISEPNWDTLSKSGASPFFYAINHKPKEAIKILRSCKNPLQYRSEDRDPLKQIIGIYEDIEAVTDIDAQQQARTMFNEWIEHISIHHLPTIKGYLSSIPIDSKEQKTGGRDIPSAVKDIALSYFFSMPDTKATTTAPKTASESATDTTEEAEDFKLGPEAAHRDDWDTKFDDPDDLFESFKFEDDPTEEADEEEERNPSPTR